MTNRIHIKLAVIQYNVLVYWHSKAWLCKIWGFHSAAAAAGILLFLNYK